MKNKLAVLMAEQGLKIADLYRDTGISKTTLMQIANNTGKGIQYETLEKLLDYFDISPNDFFGYESKKMITSFEVLGQLFIDLGKNFNELANKRKHFPKILTGWESVYTTGKHVIESEEQHEGNGDL